MRAMATEPTTGTSMQNQSQMSVCLCVSDSKEFLSNIDVLVPGIPPPSGFIAYPQSFFTSVLLSWNEPNTTLTLSGYKLEYYSGSGEAEMETKMLNFSEVNYLVDGLSKKEEILLVVLEGSISQYIRLLY